MEQLTTALKAGYAFFYVQTFEIDRAVADVSADITANDQWSLRVWDFESAQGDPDDLLNVMEESESYTAIVAKNFNWFLEDETGSLNYRAVTYIQNRSELFSSREKRLALIVVGNESFDTAIPDALRREFLQLNLRLPGKEELVKIVNEIVESAKASPKFQIPAEEDITIIADACRGLTRRGAQNALAYSIIKTGGRLDPKEVGDLRAQEIESASGLKVGRYEVGDLLGYENLKDFVRAIVNNPLSKGILLLGPPGTGKTHFAKWISTMTAKLMIEMEMSRMSGEGLVGQMENAWNAAIDTIKSIGSCILFIDEIEKGLAGVTKDSLGDSSSKRASGPFLKFLSEDRPGVFVVATCNDISKMPPEWTRAERWDGIFFVDLPGEDERDEIFRHYATTFNVDDRGMDIPEGWSGAEIKTVCRLANMMGQKPSDARKFIIPVSKTMDAEIKQLREWAKTRTIPASTPVQAAAKTLKRKRSVEL